MPSAGSVTHWLGLLKAGDHAAAQPLWERYFQNLVNLARARLRGAPKRMADEEDVALSAFDSFFRGAAEARFPQLVDRNDLCQLLVLITARKAIHLRQHERRQKRGGGKVQLETELDGASEEPLLAQVIGQEPTPDFAAQVAEECRRLLDHLGEGDLRSIALWKMEGYTTEEIAARLGCSRSPVERRLRLIRKCLAQQC